MPGSIDGELLKAAVDSLEKLDLSMNSISGTLPLVMNNLGRLKAVLLNEMLISGTLPRSPEKSNVLVTCNKDPSFCIPSSTGESATARVCGDQSGWWCTDLLGQSGFTPCSGFSQPLGSQWPAGTCQETRRSGIETVPFYRGLETLSISRVTCTPRLFPYSQVCLFRTI